MASSLLQQRGMDSSQTQIQSRSKPGPWGKEFDDLARAVSGAFLFGMPLLFTMEMWWIGAFTDLWKLLLFIGLALGVNIMLSHFAGFEEGNSLGDNISEAFRAVAIGIIASTVVLAVLNRIEFGDPLDSILGKIIVQMLPLSIGASIANAVFRGGNKGQGEAGQENGKEEGEQKESSPWRATLVDVGTTIGGAIFISFSVAPTEEIAMLAAELDYWHLLALIGLTLAVTYIIVFESDFGPQQEGDEGSPFQHPITETVMDYVVALLVALSALFLFDQVQFGTTPFTDIISKTLVLGLPAAIGGAAGRILVKRA